MLHSSDANGWQPLHEGVRSGSLEVVKYLVDMGADLGAKTLNGGRYIYTYLLNFVVILNILWCIARNGSKLFICLCVILRYSN